MKSRNYHVHGDAATVKRLLEEYEFIGRHARIVEPGHLVVYALPPKKEKKKSDPRGSSKSTKREDRPKASRS